MASPAKQAESPAAAAAGDANADGDDKPRLTEAEKKQNHIASETDTPPEQKRRQAIREGFDRLTELVPGLEGQGRSEGLVLQRTVRYMREQLEARRALVRKVEAAGGTVDDADRR
ncbi:helix-loop-helix DNA-binding domain-containing protein [Verticillium dahliae VdLs.17]|uniref:Helix-loop-helix DNA-binding domain-containing protein n=1 Tax=Verticillium dahliae (strain VdLs.17 / ATCC MYA-4575 / FGSC 10137) TaxID=498257 RepID=G2X8D3_VERDV|nr:helix-loop-helix DNA-binding domain-containing protein [Verticillium dahliae VdLs.17]EGY15220.1 helix-loop-helix DNA-binding domain-containing protein [Verticillium dahliae VdLs.17]